jgi:hypothetical protein
MNNLRWFNAIASGLIASAADRAPASCSERLREEWLAHALEMPAAASRLKFALGCYWAVMVISRQGFDVSVTNAISTAPTGAAITTAHAGPAIPLFAHEAHSTAAANVLCEINTTPLIDVMLVLLITSDPDAWREDRAAARDTTCGEGATAGHRSGHRIRRHRAVEWQ